MEAHKCIMEDRIRALETGQAETRVYIREIREDLMEIKADVKKSVHMQPPKEDTSKNWQPVVLKLIEVLLQAFFILAAVFGATKVIGK